ncbi:MAG: sulfurtransferase [Pontibacterium sp.]
MSLPLVIDAKALATALDTPTDQTNLVVWDLSDSETYHQAHIPGAIHVDASHLQLGSGAIPNKLPTQAQLSQLFSDLGLTADTHVVVYDHQNGPLAGRMIWTLNCVGHDKCSFLNGHLKAWINAGFATQKTANFAASTAFKATINHALVATKEDIINQLNNPSVGIWDARTPAEYHGEKVVNAKKGGHIPGAKNLNWVETMNADGVIKPIEEIKTLLAERALDQYSTLITHCQTHRRSGLTYLVARHIGIEDIRCYDGSWFEWGNLDDTPVE